MKTLPDEVDEYIEELREKIAKEKKKDPKAISPDDIIEYIKREASKPFQIGGRVVGDSTAPQTLVYFLRIDRPGQGIEPFYFWLLNLLSDMNYNVEKTIDQFAATETSAWFSDIQIKKQSMEKRAGDLIGAINLVVKSILNLLYEMKEFELRLNIYEDRNSEDPKTAEKAWNALKAIWLTDVDMKKQAASINVLTRDLEFVTLRDTFMAIKKPEDVDTVDANDRVKRILGHKVQEFFRWVDESERELTMRHTLEKAYLKSQVASLKLYTVWAEPYVRAAQKLKLHEFEPVLVPRIGRAESLVGGTSPELVTAFDTSKMNLQMLGLRKQSPEADIYRGVEITFQYRTIPIVSSRTEQSRAYSHTGRVHITFRPYIFEKKQLDAMKKLKHDEILQLVTQLTKESLDAMSRDLERYGISLYGAEKEAPEEVKRPPERLGKVKETVSGVTKFFGLKKKEKRPSKAKKISKFEREQMKIANEKAKEEAVAKVKGEHPEGAPPAGAQYAGQFQLIYKTFKKVHGLKAF